jgi:WhiB family redox-sensing transcriptional regulator
MTDHWSRRAACRGADPDLFFPANTGDDVSVAVALCADCAVVAECARYGRDTRSVGIFGGRLLGVVHHGDVRSRRAS